MSKPEIKIYWSDTKEEGVLKTNKVFDEAYYALQADMINDAIYDLENLKIELREKFYKG